MKLIIEIAMQGEMELDKKGSGDVSNGYRSHRIFTGSNILELQVSRTQQQDFMPLILGVLKDQEKEIKQLADYLLLMSNKKINNISNRIFANIISFIIYYLLFSTTNS